MLTRRTLKIIAALVLVACVSVLLTRGQSWTKRTPCTLCTQNDTSRSITSKPDPVDPQDRASHSHTETSFSDSPNVEAFM